MTTTGVDRRLARRVTYGGIALLLLAALVHLDAWPVSAYRLFSVERGSGGASLVLVAVAPDGSRTDVPRPTGGEPVAMTNHLYDDLGRVSPEKASAMVRAWLDLAAIDPAGVERVDLERRRWETDRETLDQGYTPSSEVVLAVEP